MHGIAANTAVRKQDGQCGFDSLAAFFVVWLGSAWYGGVWRGTAAKPLSFFMNIFKEAVITEEARAIVGYINKTWPRFQTELEVELRELFPEPENVGLKHIWKYGAADIVVRRDGQIVCVIEPGGSHHMQDEKQKRNDARKYKLCEINGVRFVQIMNSVLGNISKRQWRNLLGRFIFGNKEKQICHG